MAKYIRVMDLGGLRQEGRMFPLLHSEFRSYAQEVLGLQKFYTDTTLVNIAVNMGFLIRPIVSFASVFMTARQKRKLRSCGSANSKSTLADLREFLPDSLIRKDWGGECEFIHDVYPAPDEQQKDMWFRSTILILRIQI